VTETGDNPEFENAVNALWELDLTDLAPWMDERREEGIEDLLVYFREDPRASQRAAGQIVVKAANARARQMAGVPTVHLMLGPLDVLIGQETKEIFAGILAAAYRGERDIELAGRARTVPGDPIDVQVRVGLPEDPLEWGSVMVEFEKIAPRAE